MRFGLILVAGCGAAAPVPPAPTPVPAPIAKPVETPAPKPKPRLDRAPLVLGGPTTWAAADHVIEVRYCPGDRELLALEFGGWLRRFRVADGQQIAATHVAELTGEPYALDCRADGTALTLDTRRIPILVDAAGKVTQAPTQVSAFGARFAPDA